MTITYDEIMQMGINLMGALFCVAAALVVRLNGNNIINRIIIRLFGFESLILCSEACAYICRGNTALVYVYIHFASNLIIFLCEIILSFLGFRLAVYFIEDGGAAVDKRFRWVCYGLLLAALATLVSNIFANTMYGYDASNDYQRYAGWYIFAIAMILLLVELLVMTIVYRKQMDKNVFGAMLFYIGSPILFAMLQTFYPGMTFLNIGAIISLIVIIYANTRMVARRSGTQTDSYNKSRNIATVLLLMLTLVGCMSASIFSFVMSIRKISNENAVEQNRVVLKSVENEIDNELLRPIIVSQTVANNYYINHYFATDADHYSPKKAMAIVGSLENVREGFGYPMVFAVCEKCKYYYSHSGVTRAIDPECEEDRWYRDFVESGKKYDLNIDRDENNNEALEIFVNTGIVNDDDEFLGVCGVGVDMEDIVGHIREYEEKYNMEIILCDKDGLIQVASDTDRIENDYVEYDFSEVSENEVKYQVREQGDRLITYMENLDWYLVAQQTEAMPVAIHTLVIPSLLIFVIGLLIMSFALWQLYKKGESASSELIASQRKSRTDGLTGLYNRRAYEEDKADIIKSGNDSTIIVVVMDINGLKTVNDTIGHDAGDELLIGATGCMKSAFGNHGEVYRTGGDEFVALLECEKAELEKILAVLDENIYCWEGAKVNELSISYGYAIMRDEADRTLAELEKLADARMYENKNEYYRRTGKNRRMNW